MRLQLFKGIEMKLENTMLLMSAKHGAMVVEHPPKNMTDRKYGASVGACFTHYKTLTKEQQAIHLLTYALITMERFPELKAKDVLDALESVDEFKDIIFKCLP